MVKRYSSARRGHVLTLRRTFNGSAERLFRAWTAPEDLKKWWGPHGFTSPACKVDLRVGGEYHYCARSPQGVDFWSRGIFCEIVPPKKIVLADSFSDADGNIMTPSAMGLPREWPSTLFITVTFSEFEGKTIFTLTHEGLPFELLSTCQAGWSESLDKLQSVIDGGAPG